MSSVPISHSHRATEIATTICLRLEDTDYRCIAGKQLIEADGERRRHSIDRADGLGESVWGLLGIMEMTLLVQIELVSVCLVLSEREVGSILICVAVVAVLTCLNEVGAMIGFCEKSKISNAHLLSVLQ